jgi:ABC-type uncharacterized transport system auxiliary subunit
MFLCNFCLSGCINLSNKYIPQQKYGFDVNLPKPLAAKSGKILEIYYPEIAAPFAGMSFVYRTQTLKYTTDYYNIFFVSSAEQIYQNELKYLRATNIFKLVSVDAAPLLSGYILKTYVSELYADYRDTASPKAVMTIQFVLLDATLSPPKIIMQKTFSRKNILQQKSSEALTTAWNDELGSILRQLVSAVRIKIGR